ncbi:ABC transporter ATP-binding protein [Christensenella timonensis]|uniref:ABC transporter ATP-binding protein n=1 Tax=Christensenella timonensis TaxID=1816678 RepID=UPI001FA7C706|nr:ABC transporter ATP-binding protein [Christensenella timonensis]
MMLLKCEQVTRKYSRGEKNFFTAVNKAGFSVEAGDFVSIIGKSGSGKSTLLNMIAGLLHPTSGRILLNGKEFWTEDEKQMAYVRNTSLGYIPQGLSLLANLTALDNVRLPYFLHKREGDGAARAEMLLGKVGLKGRGGSYPSQLSGGEMKRVAIARALINEPLLLLADEPTADIDEDTTREVMELFTEIRAEGSTILMATHELDNVGYGNRVFRMSGGNLSEASIQDYQK